MAEFALRAMNIRKSFGALEVLKDVSINVAPGEVACILGPSGSGKSTFLRCLNWLSPPTGGEVWIGTERLGIQKGKDGREVSVSETKLGEQRSRFGMVFQSFNLWPHRTALQNVIEGHRRADLRPIRLLQLGRLGADLPGGDHHAGLVQDFRGPFD